MKIILGTLAALLTSCTHSFDRAADPQIRPYDQQKPSPEQQAGYAVGEGKCETLLESIRTAVAHGELEAAQTQRGAAARVCSGGDYRAERVYSDILAKQASILVEQHRLLEAESLLQATRQASWAVAAVRGDIAAARKRWDEAARMYGQAYELLSNSAHVEPTPKIVELRRRFFQLASEAQLIHGKLDASLTRGGTGGCGGIWINLCRGMRGFAVERAIVPVPFAFDQSGLDADGKRTANILVDLLKGQALLGQITLIGHTDEQGSEDYNQRLSERRAKAVAGYLRARGITIPIHAIGKGETSPPVISDPTRYSQQELWAIQRRVELQRE